MFLGDQTSLDWPWQARQAGVIELLVSLIAAAVKLALRSFATPEATSSVARFPSTQGSTR